MPCRHRSQPPARVRSPSSTKPSHPGPFSRLLNRSQEKAIRELTKVGVSNCMAVGPSAGSSLGSDSSGVDC